MSTRKGMLYQKSLLPLVNDYWPDSLSLGKQGVYDKGDFHMPGNGLYVVEAKNCKTVELSKWASESTVEAKNRGVPHWVIVHKRRGTQDPAEQWATMLFGDWLKIIHRGDDRG